MSTSLLYHAFGIRGYQYTRTDYQGGEVIFSIHQEPHTCRCSACGSPEVKPRGHVELARLGASPGGCLWRVRGAAILACDASPQTWRVTPAPLSAAAPRRS